MARWNIYLVNRGERPLLYFNNLDEGALQQCIKFSTSKMLDGSDADGFIITRSDYPVPSTWPGNR